MLQKIKQAPGRKIWVVIWLLSTVLLATLALLVISFPRAAAQVVPATNATGSGVWNWQNPLPQGNRLNSLQCLDPYQCYAAGDSGTILKRTSGASWQIQATPTTSNLLGLSCINNYTCVAVGTRGEILVTTNPSGQYWQHINTAYTTDLYSVSCINITPFSCYAVGDNGQVLKSINSGVEWTAISFPVSEPLKTIFCYRSSGTVDNCLVGGGKLYGSTGGPTGVLYQTLNNGAAWTDVHPLGAAQPFNSIHCAYDSLTTCLAVGDSAATVSGTGQAYSTTTFGTSSWTDVGGFTPLPLKSVSCAYTTHCVAVGRQGEVWNYVPTDKPAWTLQASGLPSYLNVDLYSVACIADVHNQCYAVGDFGRIISNNAGTPPWTLETTGWLGTQLTAVSCVTPGKCYAAGHVPTSLVTHFTGQILSTVDEGLSWNLQGSVTPPQQLNAIDCLNTTPVKCVAVGYVGTVFTTNDGGTTWTDHTATSATTKNLLGVKCLDVVPTTCYAVGNSPPGSSLRNVIIKSIDGGDNWVTQSAPAAMSSEELNSISCTGSLTCYAAGGSNYSGQRRVIGTTDGGVSWNSLYSQAVPNSLFYAITCPTGLVCYAAGGYNGPYSGMQVVKTTNGGASWENLAEVTVPSVAEIPAPYSISCLTATNCFTAGRNGTIMATRNGGASWTVQLSGTTNNLLGLSCLVGCVTVGDGAAILNNSVFVNNVVDDGSGVAGTLTYALAVVKPGQAVALDLPGGSLNLTNSDAGRTVPPGVAFGSPCFAPVSYNYNYHPGSLILKGNDTVVGLRIYRWISPALLIAPGASGNSLNCLRIFAP